MRVAPFIDVRLLCPYCQYAATVNARDIRGQNFVLECLDCRETFVVEVAVHVTHRVRALADVDAEAVLKKLREKPANGTATSPPSKAAVGARATTATAGERPPLKARRVQGQRYGADAPGDPSNVTINRHRRNAE